MHRIEFEIGRTGLREYGVDTPEDALGAAGALWASLTETWLTYRSPTGDATKSRWPVAPEWRAVQHARIRDDAVGLVRVTEGRPTGALGQLVPRLVSEMASFAVIVGIVVRLTSKTERKEPKDADRGILPGVDRGAGD